MTKVEEDIKCRKLLIEAMIALLRFEDTRLTGASNHIYTHQLAREIKEFLKGG